MKKDSLLAIIAGAGVGSRFESEIPKQYLILNGKSVIERAVEPFLCSNYVKKIIVVISKDDLLINKQSFYDSSKVKFIYGGEKRVNSLVTSTNHNTCEKRKYQA